MYKNYIIYNINLQQINTILLIISLMVILNNLRNPFLLLNMAIIYKNSFM